jgi:putative transposase
MPRKPRFFVPGLAAHVIQRGNNRQAIFFETADYELYLSLVGEGRDRYGCSIHAYVLMTNHVHLLLTPAISSIVDSASYLLACYRYIELNPVRAGMVMCPGDYRWSSFQGNGLAEPDGLLAPHARKRALTLPRR